jgi:hypothetical protein
MDSEMPRPGHNVEAELDAEYEEADALLRSARKPYFAAVVRKGKVLLKAKRELPHGRYLGWAEKKRLSKGSRDNYLAAAKLAEKFPSVGNLKFDLPAI